MNGTPRMNFIYIYIYIYIHNNSISDIEFYKEMVACKQKVSIHLFNFLFPFPLSSFCSTTLLLIWMDGCKWNYKNPNICKFWTYYHCITVRHWLRYWWMEVHSNFTKKLCEKWYHLSKPFFRVSWYSSFFNNQLLDSNWNRDTTPL